jgi:tagatose 6-phosphate kinase
MVLTVTLNLAIDVTYFVEKVELEKTNPVRSSARRAGGKGVNVARTLHALGQEVMVAGLAGGRNGEDARAELASAGMTDATVEVAGESRTTLIVVDQEGGATGFSEPGPHISAEEWGRFMTSFSRLVRTARVVVLSGSVPPGAPVDAYAQLIGLADDARIPVILDSHGDHLARGIEAGPAIVKVNTDELVGVYNAKDVLSGAAGLRDMGASAAVISMGPDGLVAVTDEGTWKATPPEPVRGNATGAGDAASAALAVGLMTGVPWPERLVEAAALSAAAVAAPLAGSFDPGLYRRLTGQIRAEELSRATPEG